MRIAILCHMHHPIAEPYEGGTEAHTAMLADGLVARGHDVTLFAKEGSATAARSYPLVPRDFEFTRIASPLVRKQQRGFLAEAVFHSISIIRQQDFDLVINNSLSALPYTHLRGVPMMTILHTPPTLADVTAVLVNPSWVPDPRHSYVTVSETNAASWRGMLPEVQVVHNGIDLDRWDVPSNPTPGRAVWAARITPEKGLHLAIDAARLASMTLDFVGPIAHEDYYATEIEPRFGPDVRYLGHLSHTELPAFLATGEVFVASPLWAEPFGLSAIEAMGAGTPVAAFPNGALVELVPPRAGTIATAVTATALAAAIASAASRDRDEVRATAAEFSLDRMLDGYQRVLDELVQPAAGSDEQTLSA